MFKIFLFSFLFSLSLFANCDSGYESRNALINLQPDGKTINNIICPTISSNNEGCQKLSFEFTEDNSIKCIYYELEDEKVNNFNKLLKENEYLENKDNSSFLEEHNIKILSKPKNEKRKELNEELLQKVDLASGSNDLSQYFPEFKMTFLDKSMKDLNTVNKIKWNFGTTITKDKGMCKKCQEELNAPTIDLNNVLSNITNEIGKLENQIKEQATSVTDELGSTLYDLTSDEAVISYYISGISYGIASASCVAKQTIDTTPDAVNLGYLATKGITKSANMIKNDTPDKTLQKEKSKNSGCFFSIDVQCIIPNPLSGVEFGVSQKTQSVGNEQKSVENQAMTQQIDEDKYDVCMKTEPDKIMDKIIGYLKNVVNGVDIDLFAVKQCSDDKVRKEWGLGTGNYSSNDENINRMILESFINSKISDIDFKTQQVVGYLNNKTKTLYNKMNSIQGKNSIKNDFQTQLEINFKSALKSNTIKQSLINKYITNSNYNNTIKNALLLQINSIGKVFDEIDNMKNKLLLLSEEMGNNNISSHLSDFIVKNNLRVLKEVNNEVYKTFFEINNNPQKSFSKKIGCVTYSNDKCIQIGIKYDVFGKLSERFRNYKIKYLDNSYIIFKDKSLSEIQNYITSQIIPNGDFSYIKGSDSYELVIEYYKVLTFKNIIDILEQSELQVSKSTLNMSIKETTTFNKILYKLFDINNYKFN